MISWTARPNPIGAKPPAGSAPISLGDAGLLILGFLALPAAAAWGRRRRITIDALA